MFARIGCRSLLALIVMCSSLGEAQTGSTAVIPMGAVPTEGFAGLPGEGSSAITGAPFCAEVVTTRTQTLADGNRLQNKRSDHVCRDSKGRTRRETSPTVTPATEPSAVQAVRSIVIFDPSANLVINLCPVQHKAIERPTRISMRPAIPRTLTPSGRPTRQQVPKNDTHVTTRAGDDVVEENLGEDSVHGVVAKGTKITRTIPAGHMGNDISFMIVTERWYSEDLKTVMRLKQTDPRVGETSSEVTNIVPGEPDASLFQIPADYKVEELQRASAPNR